MSNGRDGGEARGGVMSKLLEALAKRRPGFEIESRPAELSPWSGDWTEPFHGVTRMPRTAVVQGRTFMLDDDGRFVAVMSWCGFWLPLMTDEETTEVRDA